MDPHLTTISSSLLQETKLKLYRQSKYIKSINIYKTIINSNNSKRSTLGHYLFSNVVAPKGAVCLILTMAVYCVLGAIAELYLLFGSSLSHSRPDFTMLTPAPNRKSEIGGIQCLLKLHSFK